MLRRFDTPSITRALNCSCASSAFESCPPAMSRAAPSERVNRLSRPASAATRRVSTTSVSCAAPAVVGDGASAACAVIPGMSLISSR